MDEEAIAHVGSQRHKKKKKKKSTQVINTMVSEPEVLTLLIPTPELGKILTYYQNKHPPPTHHTRAHARTHAHTHH